MSHCGSRARFPLTLAPHIAYDDALWMVSQTRAYSSPDGLTWTEHAKTDWGQRIYEFNDLLQGSNVDIRRPGLPGSYLFERHLVLRRWRYVVENRHRGLVPAR